MEITFENKKMAKLANDTRHAQKILGVNNARIFKRRLDDMRAVATLEDCKKLPGKYHELVGNRKGQISVHLEEPQRLIFVPAENPLPYNEHGILEWDKITSARIIESEKDYH